MPVAIRFAELHPACVNPEAEYSFTVPFALAVFIVSLPLEIDTVLKPVKFTF